MAITGYNSPVDIGLGQSPQSTDPELFQELTEVYNAIHLLNQYLDQLRYTASGGSGSGATPAASMPYTRFFTATALTNISVGQIVSPSNIAGENGIILGGLAHDYKSTAPESNFSQVALTDALVNTPVQVGVGPAILAIPGAVNGQVVYCFPARDTAGNKFNNGNLYLTYPGTITISAGPPAVTVTAMPIAVCVKDGFVMFGQFIKR